MNNRIIVFGGADRQQTHFQDVAVYTNTESSKLIECVKTHGDIPMGRSGHSVVAYGKYMLLFGGINFAEEAVYNDLYILDTGTATYVLGFYI